LYERAGAILDSRAPTQEGKTVYSNRYAFSGKIKCGRCGAAYVARYKKRQDGSQYKAWRCLEATRYGGVHTDNAGNVLGCTSESIRNEDALHIMSLVCKSLKPQMKTAMENVNRAVQNVIAEGTGIDTIKLDMNIKQIGESRARLVELYMNGDITKAEFMTARDKCDAKLAEIQEMIDGVKSQQAIREGQDALLSDIEHALNEMVERISYDDRFYRDILDNMTVVDKDHIDVHLKMLPFKWSYAVSKASKIAGSGNRNTVLHDLGTEELAHLEMIGAICHQLVKDATPVEMQQAGMDANYVDHGLGIYPQSAGGIPWSAQYIQSKGDPITDLYEDMAADEKAKWHNQDKNKPTYHLKAQ